MADGTDEFSAVLRMPDWFWGMDPKVFLGEARLHVRKGTSPNEGWTVQTFERYRRQASPRLIDVLDIAGPGILQPRWERLSEIPDPVEMEYDQDLRSEIQRLRTRAENSSELVHLFNSARLELAVIGNESLGEQARCVMDAIHGVTISDDGSKAFGEASMHLVRKNSALVHRMKLAQVLLRVDAGATLHDLLEEAKDGASTSFPASNGLLTGMYLLDVYLRPLIGAVSPAVWGFVSHRTKGSMIVGLGSTIAGTTGESSELLQMLTSSSQDEARDNPRINAEDTDSAIHWWADALDHLLGAVSEPAIHRDYAGVYSPTRHLEVMLTVEQLFERVAAIQGAHRDVATARALFFAVIDTLTWFTGKSFDDYCHLGYANRTLERLEAELPQHAANLLLPNARRAVTALRDLQSGFFTTRTVRAHVDLAGPNGFKQRLKTEVAVAHYVSVLRNAVHGHGAKKHPERGAALMSQHNGNIPGDLALVGYLHFLDMLARPESVRKKLTADSRRPPRPSTGTPVGGNPK